MRKLIPVLLLVCLAGWMSPARAVADENSFETVFKDGFYGGLAGALVGGAALALRNHPGDHLNYLSYGAAIGVFAGVTFGLVTISHSLAELDDHRLVFHLPTPMLVSGPTGPAPNEVIGSIGILTVRF
ncbi:MAG TPA: hypothetical protein VLY20_07380 [Nitrospiria bacterium]|nr:hypothetical protein [Nitrospiria bacterium]HUK56463.1 hypothetical protein [Nitrospiria bacterium]